MKVQKPVCIMLPQIITVRNKKVETIRHIINIWKRFGYWEGLISGDHRNFKTINDSI